MLFGSAFQRLVTTALSLSVTAGTDAVFVTATGKTLTLPLARTCTLEDGNNVIRIVGVGFAVTVAPTSPDALATGQATATIGSNKCGYAESDGLSKWWVYGDAA